MYHIDPNINVAVERQVERVRAVQAYHQSPPPEPAESAWLNENEVRALQLPRWWPVAAAFVIVIGLLLFAWSVAAAP